MIKSKTTRRNRIEFLSLLLLGLTASSTQALEPTPIENLSLKLSVVERTDSAARKDMEAARKFFAQSQAPKVQSAFDIDQEKSEPENQPATSTADTDDSDSEKKARQQVIYPSTTQTRKALIKYLVSTNQLP